jgi:hypothetical protein
MKSISQTSHVGITDSTCVYNPKTGEIEGHAIIYKPVLAWAVTAAGVVPLLTDTRDNEILQARLLKASSRTFVVYVETGDGSLIELRIHSPGASHPNWSDLAQDVLAAELGAGHSASSLTLVSEA